MKADSIASVSRKRLVVNTVARYVQFGACLFFGILTQGLVIRSLGKVEYSLWPLVQVSLSVLNVIPIVVGAGGERFIAHALGEKNPDEVAKVTTSIFVCLCVAGVGYALVTILLALNFDRLFTIPGGMEGRGVWLMLILGVTGSLMLPLNIFGAGLSATQHYLLQSVTRVTVTVLRFGFLLAFFWFGYKNLLIVAISYFIFECCYGVVLFFCARKLVPWQRIRAQSFSIETLKTITKFNGYILLNYLAGLMYWQMDSILINKLFNPVLLTGYSVVVTFVQQAQFLVSQGVAVIRPAATVLHGADSMGRLTRMVYRATGNLVPIAAPLFFFFMFFGTEMLTVYIGKEYAEFGYLFGILSVAVICSSTQSASGVIPQAIGKMEVITWSSVVAAVVKLAASLLFIFAFKWELKGVAYGTLFATVALNVFYLPAYYARILNVRLQEYMVATYVRPLLACLPFAVCLFGFKAFGYGQGWIELGVVLAVSGLCHGLCLISWSLPYEERLLIWSTLEGVRMRLRVG